MLIDAASQPIRISASECPTSLVLRTAATKDVDGKIRHSYDVRTGRPGEKRQAGKVVPPVVSLPREGRTIIETKISLSHFGGQKLPSVYEVVSGFQNNFTKKQGSWRLNLIVEFAQKKEDIWTITILDETNNHALVTLVSRELQKSSIFPELTPLQRFIKTDGKPTTVWDHITADEDD